MIFKILYTIHDRSTGERGAVAAEYAVLLALIAVVLVAAVEGLSGAISGALDTAADVITG
jgi:Flp pilus assembly pilin Flp